MIQQCPHCHGSLDVPENCLGMQLQCPLCKQVFIPRGQQPTATGSYPPPSPPQMQNGGFPMQQPMNNGIYPGTTAGAGTGEYAPHGHRILAYLIDVLVMFIPNLVLEFAVGFVLGLILGNSEATKGIIYIANCVVGFLVIAGYEGLTHCNTVGKRTMKLAVVFDDIPQGTEIPFDRAMKRGAAKWLSGAICGIGLLMAFFSQTHQALHDQLCKCQVVKMD